MSTNDSRSLTSVEDTHKALIRTMKVLFNEIYVDDNDPGGLKQEVFELLCAISKDMRRAKTKLQKDYIPY